jgi:hypothetical protein
MTDPFAEGVANRPNQTGESQQQVVDTLNADERQAGVEHSKAITGDVKANTWLKIGLSVFICLLILGWFFGLFWYLGRYFDQMNSLEQIIPEAVMLAVIGAGATIVGLMGFILKGLFKSN